MKKLNDRMRSELEQLEHSNTTTNIWPTNAGKKIPLLIDKRFPLETKRPKKDTWKCLFEIRNENSLNRPATLYEILLVESSAAKDQIKKHYLKMSLLTHLDDSGVDEFFKNINRAYHILRNDAA